MLRLEGRRLNGRRRTGQRPLSPENGRLQSSLPPILSLPQLDQPGVLQRENNRLDLNKTSTPKFAIN